MHEAGELVKGLFVVFEEGETEYNVELGLMNV